jgi:hypothetical protein
VFERSELSEAPAELSDRREKKNSEPASEVGGRSPSRSKGERIKIKMLRSNNAGWRSIKRGLLGERGRGKWEDTVASQKYTPVFRARARSNNISLFF